MLNTNFFNLLAKNSFQHSNKTNFYEICSLLTNNIFLNYSLRENPIINLWEYGEIKIPFYSFGNITTLQLFGLDELIIFSFYLKNQKNYKKVIDIGGNIGLHSILMSKLGWEVEIYEPDPDHIKVLKNNLELNDCLSNTNVNAYAVYNSAKELDFIRVLGNTTGSHISGMKENPYGKLEKFQVMTKDIRSIVDGVDFIKLDAEGAEADIVSALNEDILNHCDIMLEISTKKSAEKILNHINKMDTVNLYTQKNNWQVTDDFNQIPTNHKEGSTFITSKSAVPF